jgi:hypothetical protein
MIVERSSMRVKGSAQEAGEMLGKVDLIRSGALITFGQRERSQRTNGCTGGGAGLWATSASRRNRSLQ